jgi:hypothetical protein
MPRRVSSLRRRQASTPGVFLTPRAQRRFVMRHGRHDTAGMRGRGGSDSTEPHCAPWIGVSPAFRSRTDIVGAVHLGGSSAGRPPCDGQRRILGVPHHRDEEAQASADVRPDARARVRTHWSGSRVGGRSIRRPLPARRLGSSHLCRTSKRRRSVRLARLMPLSRWRGCADSTHTDR